MVTLSLFFPILVVNFIELASLQFIKSTNCSLNQIASSVFSSTFLLLAVFLVYCLAGRLQHCCGLGLQLDDVVKRKRKKKFSCKILLYEMHVVAILKPNP